METRELEIILPAEGYPIGELINAKFQAFVQDFEDENQPMGRPYLQRLHTCTRIVEKHSWWTSGISKM